MKLFKRGFLVFIAAIFVCAGFYGCAKKQIKNSGGEIKSQQPSTTATKTAPAAPSEKTVEAPPAQKELTQPTEAGAAEKALKDIHFDFNKYSIRPEDGTILQANAKWIKANKPGVVLIEGNCDERGTVEYNLALGERRAEAAEKYLMSLGIKKSELKTISYGKSKPLDPAHNEAAWAKNRRDDFVVQ
ncbi:MAG: peptidoglycan-associated lipoprotein Pal [Nitrospirota bacterium]